MGAKSRVPGKVNGAMLFKIYGKGSKADLEVLATIKNVSVTKAKEMIQDKIRGRLPSGPAELRRTFQFFDRDGGGTVSIDEFKYALKRYCGLQFEENLLQKLMAEFDKDGSGELDFAKFSQLVLGSTPETDGTSVTDNSALLAISDDNGNSDMMLRRKVREKWRSLITMFKQTSDASGDLTPAQLKSVLYKHDILVAEKQFHVMLAEMDEDGDGVISYSEFLKYFDKGQADEVSLTPTITAMPLDKVTELIQDKVAAKMPGGPAALRRAWTLFNGDGTGEIDGDEFARVLKTSLGLIFGGHLFASMLAQYDGGDGSGKIDFNKFCKNIMQSSAADATSISNSAGKRTAIGDDNGNSEQMLRRQVRERWKDLHVAFKHQSTKQADGNRALSPEQLRDLLESFDIFMENRFWEQLVTQIDEDNDGMIDVGEFMRYFGKGSKADKEVIATIRNLSVSKAKELIRDTVRSRLPSGPAELRRTFQFFDRDGSGTVSFAEFSETLELQLGLKFEDRLLKQMMNEFELDEQGEMDFKSFTELVTGSSQADGTSMYNPDPRYRRSNVPGAMRKKSSKTRSPKTLKVNSSFETIPESDSIELKPTPAGVVSPQGILKRLAARVDEARDLSGRGSGRGSVRAAREAARGQMNSTADSLGSFWESLGSDRLALPAVG